MQIPGVKTAKLFARWVRARVVGGALILGYHRITNLTGADDDVCVTPKHFAQQMEALSKVARPTSLRELVRCLKSGSLPPNAVAVTFDDGYADNLQEAKPVLEKYQIPATVFVCTGYLGREFWWDELDRLVLSSETELGALRLKVGEKSFGWDQPNVSPEAAFASRRKFRRALYRFLLQLDIEEQNQVMSTIRSWSRISSDGASLRAMTQRELLQLVDGGLIEIGAHTRHHPMLPQLSLERQREEIISNKQDLEDIVGRPVDGFAYPNGRATDDAKRIVREAGFAFACASVHDVVRPASDPHGLSRFWQRDVDSRKFLQGLHLWMKGS